MVEAPLLTMLTVPLVSVTCDPVANSARLYDAVKVWKGILPVTGVMSEPYTKYGPYLDSLVLNGV